MSRRKQCNELWILLEALWSSLCKSSLLRSPDLGCFLHFHRHVLFHMKHRQRLLDSLFTQRVLWNPRPCWYSQLSACASIIILYVHVSCPTLCTPGYVCLWNFPARILEWVAISSSRGSSRPRDQIWVSCISCIGRQILYHCAAWEAQSYCKYHRRLVRICCWSPFHYQSLLNVLHRSTVKEGRHKITESSVSGIKLKNFPYNLK